MHEHCPNLTDYPLPICPHGRDTDDAFCFSHETAKAYELCADYQRARAEVADAEVARLREAGDAVVRAARPLLELHSQSCFDSITAAAALANWQALREAGAALKGGGDG
jgi:hypothetical protein